MQPKESRACEARGCFGVAPAGHSDAGLYLHFVGIWNYREMQTCVYTNAGLRLRIDHP